MVNALKGSVTISVTSRKETGWGLYRAGGDQGRSLMGEVLGKGVVRAGRDWV